MPSRGAKSGGRRQPLSVGEFYERYRDDLGLSLHSGEAGFEKIIKEPTINRPGLALAGFFTYFAFRRIQDSGTSR